MCIDIVTPVISTIKKGEAAIPPGSPKAAEGVGSVCLFKFTKAV